jgi:hypothetical protein
MVQQYAVDELPLQIQLAGYFEQDGTPLHFSLSVRAYLDHISRSLDRSHCTISVASTLP